MGSTSVKMGRTYEEMVKENHPDRPDTELKLGEHLAYDTRDKVWKVWGRDKLGIYAWVVLGKKMT